MKTNEDKKLKTKRMLEFGKYIADLRSKKGKGISVRDVAKATGISNPYLYQIENGTKALTDPDMFLALALYFNVPVQELLTRAGYIKTLPIRPKIVDSVRTTFKKDGKVFVKYIITAIIDEYVAANGKYQSVSQDKKDIVHFTGEATVEEEYAGAPVFEEELFKTAITDVERKFNKLYEDRLIR